MKAGWGLEHWDRKPERRELTGTTLLQKTRTREMEDGGKFREKWQRKVSNDVI